MAELYQEAMRIEVRGDRDSFEDEIVNILDCNYRYSYSVNPYEYEGNIFCTIDEEQYPNAFQLKKIEKFNLINRLENRSKVREKPKDSVLKAWSDNYENKIWRYHLTLNRFVFDMPRIVGNLSPIELRFGKHPSSYRNKTGMDKKIWRKDCDLIMNELRKFLRFHGIDKHPRDFVWLAAVETSSGYDSVHIHILLQDLGLDDFKVFKSLIEQFNVFMLSSSVNNKMKGFHLYLAPQIVKTPVEIANRVNYVLKDQEIPKFVYHSRYLNEFKKDTTADIIKALL